MCSVILTCSRREAESQTEPHRALVKSIVHYKGNRVPFKMQLHMCSDSTWALRDGGLGFHMERFDRELQRIVIVFFFLCRSIEVDLNR